METSISSAKISRPTLNAYHPRPRLLRTLNAQPMVWVCAPAGYGKTSLVAHYAESEGLDCLWYHMDESDGDAASFFHHLARAAEELWPQAEPRLPHFTIEDMFSLARFARLFFRALFQRAGTRALWVLDNYHELPESSVLHEILSRAFAEAPAGLQIIVCTRRRPLACHARLLASSKMAIVEKELLRLTEEETKAVCRLQLPEDGKRLTDGLLSELYEKSQGWPAGLVLLLHHLKQSGGECLPAEAREVVFDYLANESFRLSSPAVRKTLMFTAFLPRFTVDMARRITGLDFADTVLEDMCLENQLVFRHQGNPVTYSCHPLYREFLVRRVLCQFGEEELEKLRRDSANLLLRAGQLDAGASLLHRNADWRRLAELVLEYAPILSRQGRSHLLLTWIDWLPEEYLQNSPWLSYWKGILLFPFDSEAGRQYLELAFHRFKENKDVVGQLSAWSGIIESIICEWGYIKPLDYWIAEIEPLLSSLSQPLTQELEARVAFAMFIALMNRQPQHPELPRWVEETWQVVFDSPDVVTRVTCASHLLIYLVWWRGELGRAKALIDAVDPLVEKEDIPVFTYITWRTMSAGYYWMIADDATARSLLEETAGLAEETGIHIWDSLICCQGVITTLSMDETEPARRYLETMKERVAQARPQDRAMYYYVSAWFQYLQEDLGVARQSLETALAMTEEAGCVFFRGVVRVQLGLLQHRMEEREAAAHSLAQAEEEGRFMHVETILCLVAVARSECAFYDGAEADALEHMQQAIDLCRLRGILNHPWWQSRFMSAVLAKMLAENRETEWVRRLIRSHRLSPPQDACDLERWPWPIKIYTLGRFEILRDGKPLRITGKAKKRPLQLLKLMIALGGRDVSAAQVIDILWPDASGDDAMENLRVTVGRLRRLLQCREAVVYTHGRLSLDTARSCWLDCWAFNRMLGNQDVDEAWQEKAFQLYQGAFLKSEPDAAWALPLRENLCAKYRDLVLAVGHRLESAGDWQACAALYEQSLHVDESAEVFYQKLMTCYARLGRSSDVAAAFRRCEKMLMVSLGIAPSAQTLSIFHHCTDTGSL